MGAASLVIKSTWRVSVMQGPDTETGHVVQVPGTEAGHVVQGPDTEAGHVVQGPDTGAGHVMRSVAPRVILPRADGRWRVKGVAGEADEATRDIHWHPPHARCPLFWKICEVDNDASNAQSPTDANGLLMGQIPAGT